MSPQSFRIIWKVETRPSSYGQRLPLHFRYEYLTANNCDQKIRGLFPTLRMHITPGRRHFSIPIQLIGRTYEADIDLGQINITRIFAILRIFGWSGNLAYGLLEGETTPRWHWVDWIANSPDYLPR